MVSQEYENIISRRAIHKYFTIGSQYFHIKNGIKDKSNEKLLLKENEMNRNYNKVENGSVQNSILDQEQLDITDMLESIALNLENVSSTQSNHFDKACTENNSADELGLVAVVFRNAASNLRNNTRSLIE